MPANPVLSRELKSLQDEIEAAQRERQRPIPLSRTAERESAKGMPLTDPAPEKTDEERQMSDQLTEFLDQVAQFFHEAENNIAEHPLESVSGALIVGILIGRLIGRR